jgi:hypothetical protein
MAIVSGTDRTLDGCGRDCGRPTKKLSCSMPGDVGYAPLPTPCTASESSGIIRLCRYADFDEEAEKDKGSDTAVSIREATPP